MDGSQVRAALGAAKSTASSLGLRVDDVVVIYKTNRLTLRLLPCDVLARVAPTTHQAGILEVEVARRLAEVGGPVAELAPSVEPRAFVQDGFVVSLWTYYEPVSTGDVPPAEYARALVRLHAAMREIDLPTPHFTDRIAEAQGLVASHSQTPALSVPDRELLSSTLGKLRLAISRRGAAEQLLHGEPHPGNVLRTSKGLLFADFETACHGPVEFDVAHMPEDVSQHYPGADQELVAECRMLMMAMVAAWRWDRDDRFPNGRQMGVEMLSQLRGALDQH